MKRITAAIILFTAFGVLAFGQGKTDIDNAAAARTLIGRHKLSLQWISWDYFGVATVTNRRGVY